MSYNLAQSNSAFHSCLNRMMVLCFLSRALPRARHSPSPLGRQLCSAGANKPVLTLFTKVRAVYTIKLGEAVCLSALIHRNHRLNGLSLIFFAPPFKAFCFVGFCTPGFAAQSCSHCSRQELATNKDFRTVLPQ